MAYTTIEGDWHAPGNLSKARWTCGFCSQEIQSNTGYHTTFQGGRGAGHTSVIKICGNCNAPTLFLPDGTQSPAPAPAGGPIANCPADLDSLFEQARRSLGANAPTACVLVCRKIIHHIAVDRRGTAQGKFGNFKEAIEYLNDNHYLPPGGDRWVHYVRDRANEENHEIKLMSREDADALLMLTRHLLIHIYDLPSRVPVVPPTP
jgi:hypothetical protein